MKTVRDIMTADVIRLSPTNKIKTAIILMKGHNIGGLPVLENDQVVGMLDYHDVLGKDNDVLVQHIMDREFVTIPTDMPVNDAANLMTNTGASRLLVVEDSRLIGVVTRGDLLPEIGKSFDPITGLPRTDSMRDWGIDALKRGQEITVIFVDLDQFGQFNKKYGHITGDKVLKHVAKILQESVDEEQDMLCRYAGDEFVIVTTRNSEEAKVMAEQLVNRITVMADADLPEPVTGSIGLHGGKRTKEREDVHYEATLDNLINLASRSCTMSKQTDVAVGLLNGAGTTFGTPPSQDAQPLQEDVPPPAAERPIVEDAPLPTPTAAREDMPPGDHRRLKLHSLNLSWGSGSTATVEVELLNGEASVKHSRSGFALGNNALRLVAEATASAVTESLRIPGHGIIADSINLVQGYGGSDVVLATAIMMTPQAELRLSGSCIVKQDAYRAAAAALLNAVNRQIASLI
jgi:diguanylate cyclase (GGDEF)-like protein